MKGKIMTKISSDDLDISLPSAAELEEMRKKNLNAEKISIAKNKEELKTLTDPSDIETIYRGFERNIELYEDLAPKYMDAMEEGFKNKNNDRLCFTKGYDVISRAVELNPELAKKGHDIIVCSLLSENHKKDSIRSAEATLERLEYKNPELRSKENLFEKQKDTSGKTFYAVKKDALNKAPAVKSEILRNIIKNKEHTH